VTAPHGVVASTLARLRNVADAASVSFNEILQAYAIERFLARVAKLPDAETVLLKGAMMLRVWGVPRARPTMDVDLLKRGAADQDSLIDLVRRCVAVADAADAVEFDAASIVAESITEDAAYIGTRVRLLARLANVRQAVQIDFGVGDVVYPGPVRIDFPLLLGGEPVQLNAYPVEASIAEKFHAMVEHDLRNSRMKDFHDIWTLSKNCTFQHETLSKAIRATFGKRETSLPTEVPPGLTAAYFDDTNHRAQWRAFCRRIERTELAESLPQIAAEIAAFIMPAVLATPEQSAGRSWPPGGGWS